jgi:hypothetical protein
MDDTSIQAYVTIYTTVAADLSLIENFITHTIHLFTLFIYSHNSIFHTINQWYGGEYSSAANNQNNLDSGLNIPGELPGCSELL